MRFSELPTPCYVVDEALVEGNLKVLRGVMERTGAKILLAQKAFSMYALYPLVGRYLSGAAASGLYEARLCAEEMAGAEPEGTEPEAEKTKTESAGKEPEGTEPEAEKTKPEPAGGEPERTEPDRRRRLENHIFSPAYREEDFGEILKYCGHIVFNSWKQVEKYGARAKRAGKSIGLRVNPECSTQKGHEIYDPCAPGSRLGVTKKNFESGMKKTGMISLLDGIHFHTLCEQNSDALERTLDAVEEKFGGYLAGMKWINFGGGHHITREDYDIPRLERCIRRIQERYGLEVYLEPGEAVALNAGFLVTTVLETVHNGMEIAILDTSAACHMPDVLEMPYRPPLQGAAAAGEKACTYRLGGPTCLAGDIIGDYSFDAPLREGDRLVFEDMAIYSMVKNNTFNGMPLPAIALRGKDGECRLVKRFGYGDFKGRL